MAPCIASTPGLPHVILKIEISVPRGAYGHSPRGDYGRGSVGGRALREAGRKRSA